MPTHPNIDLVVTHLLDHKPGDFDSGLFCFEEFFFLTESERSEEFL